MSLIQRSIGIVLRPVSELRAGRRSLDDLADRLEADGKRLEAKFSQAEDSPRNREALNHIVGIERWGQRRLRVASGEPPLLDSHRGYRLEGASLDELRRAFGESRRQTVALARELAAAGADPARKVRHNDLGELSLRGWLVYLNDHANRESLRLKQ